ncbi:MAG TPA: hypothetical protein VIG30_09230 [Ktedonobacterales bacterium]
MRQRGSRRGSRRATWRTVVLVMASVAVLLAGCGGGSSAAQAPTMPATGATGGGTGTPGATSSATATPAAGAPVTDAYSIGQALPHYQSGPDSWAWRATLPGSRIILYYGIVGSPQGGVIGYYGGDENGLLNRLQNQGQAYAQLDPSHPVVMGLDIVDPLADAAPQQGFYIDRMGPDILQHYLDLTRANHMLLFFDMQIGYSSMQRELTYLLPYLQYPWVNVAIDPEWDHAHNGQSEGCPGVQDNIDATGRMYASEINYVIAQLSALVIANHLPPKTLVLHQYQYGEDPNNGGYICDNRKPSEGWQNIHPMAGVNLVINCDGVGSSLYGGLSLKLQVYSIFDHDQQIGLAAEHIPVYTAIKLYYYYPDLGLAPNFYDDPQMTPQEVLALDPPPLLVMYQ